MSNKTTRTTKKPRRQAKLNVRLLRRIQKHILAEPRRLAMKIWKTGSDAPCKTAACIAGWTCILSDCAHVELHEIARTASGLLALPWIAWPPVSTLPDDGTLAAKLFLLDEWPDKYSESYDKARSDKGRARVTARRIDHFIKYRE